ncbi:hypothetical protein [Cellulophaga tyrosinoxydans]|uniref:Uncharacterized protein n=1 Tax=Cellulophaga tyrosinoxydans TaxID=504486 RepID=A0A1W2ALE2_9FLAO|nr:hypothetical protein [Cellulophaga tyrosinoxydans]SMC61483.1 hypothetical protein SAMN05660703_2026 [Cellulophaga tyrosinoxydans]
MLTFFSILLVLVGLNAALLLFSVNSNKKRTQKTNSNIADYSPTKIYPLNIIEAKYKKAV